MEHVGADQKSATSIVEVGKKPTVLLPNELEAGRFLPPRNVNH